MKIQEIKTKLKKYSNKEKVKTLPRFFKTSKGEYGDGDIFNGVSVPNLRKIAKEYELELKEIKELLKSKIHEERQLALIILVNKYEKAKRKGNEEEKKEIFYFYLNNLERINNWDLVDISCSKIIGDYLIDKKSERKILYELAKSKKGLLNKVKRPSTQKSFCWQWLWERRIAIVSTFAFIKKNDLDDTFYLAKLLLKEKHDLLHKAVGWMLREAGKKDETRLKKFLKENYNQIPRTTLRYAIEKFEEKKRKKILIGKFK